MFFLFIIVVYVLRVPKVQRKIDVCLLREFEGGDLFDQKLLLLVELLFLFFREEVREELDQALLVTNKDSEDGRRFVRIGDEHFKYMKRLKLDRLALVLEHRHHLLEIAHITDKPCHHAEVRSIKKKFTQKLLFVCEREGEKEC